MNSKGHDSSCCCGCYEISDSSLFERYRDLVRHQRAPLHEAGLISDDEYASFMGDGGASVERLQSYDKLKEERENILSALGEHPDSPVDIPQRISDVRDEGRAHFHKLTETGNRLNDERRRVSELSAEVCRLNALLSSEIFKVDELKRRNKKFEDEYVHEKLLLDCQDKLAAANKALQLRQQEWEQLADGLSPRRQPMALNCTKCGSTIHTDSFHSESCPNGYR